MDEDTKRNDSVDEAFGVARPKRSLDEVQALASVEERMFGREPGSAKLDRYVLEERIGRGGLGVVYAAHDPELNRRVAVKLLQAQAGSKASASEGQARLLREAQALAQISHPNVIAVHDVGTYEGWPLGQDDDAEDEPSRGVFVVMELVDGDNAADWLGAESRSWREVLDMFIAAGRGLVAAHGVGLVHRDFKPANVLVGADGRVRVLDFGLARAIASAEEETPGNDTEQSDDQRLTRAGTVMGTPAYMAPEQHRGDDVDARSDQYGFCVALYEGLCGRSPFVGANAQELYDAKLTNVVPIPPDARKVPAWLTRIVVRGLQAEPPQRYGSVESLLGDIERGLGRNRRIGIAAVLLASVVAAAAGGAIASELRGDPAPVANVTETEVAPNKPARPTNPHRIAFFPFVDETEFEELDFTPVALPNVLADEIGPIKGLTVVRSVRLRRRVGGTGRPESEWREQAAELGAAWVITGRLERTPDEKVRVILVLSEVHGPEKQRYESVVKAAEVFHEVRMRALDVGESVLGVRVERPVPESHGMDFERDLAAGIEALENDQLKMAAALLREAQTKAKSPAKVHYYLSLALTWLPGHEDEASREIELALAGDLSENRRAYLEAYKRQVAGDYEQAIERFRKAEVDHPGDHELLYGLYESLYHGGRPREAMDVYAKIRKERPGFTLGSIHVVLHYAAWGDVERVEWALEPHEERELLRYEEWRVRAVLMGRRQYREAIDRLEELTADDQVPDWVVRGLVEAYAVAGQTSAALTRAEQLFASDRREMTLHPLLALHAARGNREALEQHLDYVPRLIRKEPEPSDEGKSWNHLGLLALVYGSEARTQWALDGLNRSLDPSFERRQFVHLGRAMMLGALGKTDALASMRRKTKFEAVRATVDAFMAERKGEVARAAEKWQEAMETTVESRFFIVTQRFLQARSLVKAGKYREVIETCDKVIHPSLFDWVWGPAIGHCLVWSGDAHRELGAAAEAKKAYDSVISLRTKDPDGALVKAARAGLAAL